MKSFTFSSTAETLSHISSNPNMGYVIFSTVDNVKNLSLNLSDNVVLCSTAGECTSHGYKNGVITGFEYSLEECEVNTVEILYPPIKSKKKLEDTYLKVKNNPNSFLLLLCDGLSGMEESILTTLFFIKDDFKIIGGSAGDNLKFDETAIYIGSKKVHSAALFFNSKKQVQILKENIYIPTGDNLLITEADPINRIVKKFNGNPASTEYAKILGVKESELQSHFMNHPLGKIYKDDIFIASPMKINADKSITFYCQLLPNTFVSILKPTDAISRLRTTLNSISIKANFIFQVNCILRSLKFQEENLWSAYDKEILSFCPNASGFVSYGEQFYKNHSNQTLVILVSE